MTTRRNRRGRPGFTLLEVVLATAVAVLLLGALYVAVDMQLRYAQISRDIVTESTLSRAILARIDNDASQVVGLSDPARFRLAASSANSTTGAAASTTTAATTSAASATNTAATTSTAGAPTPIVLPLGVQGDSETLHLFISRVPREIYANSDAPPVVSDLRRVSFWLVGGSDSPSGLARQEIPLVTSDDATENLPPGIDNEASFIIAEEVRSLSFEYWDGTEWQDSWDSTTLGADGVTPQGSPRAIAVTIGILPSGATAAADGSNIKTYRHVIVISSANGTTPQDQTSTGGVGAATP